MKNIYLYVKKKWFYSYTGDSVPRYPPGLRHCGLGGLGGMGGCYAVTPCVESEQGDKVCCGRLCPCVATE